MTELDNKMLSEMNRDDFREYIRCAFETTLKHEHMSSKPSQKGVMLEGDPVFSSAKEMNDGVWLFKIHSADGMYKMAFEVLTDGFKRVRSILDLEEKQIL